MSSILNHLFATPDELALQQKITAELRAAHAANVEQLVKRYGETARTFLTHRISPIAAMILCNTPNPNAADAPPEHDRTRGR